MKNIWLVELYKIKKSVVIKIIFFVTIVYALSDVFYFAKDRYDAVSEAGFAAFISSQNMWARLLLISSFLVTVIIGLDFDTRGIQKEISLGYKRSNIMIVKWVNYMISSIGMILLYQIIYVGGISIKSGFCKNFTIKLFTFMIIEEVAMLILMCGLFSICAFCGFLLRKAFPILITLIIFIFFGSSILIRMGQMGGIAEKIYNATLFGQINKLTVFAYEVIELDTYTTVLKVRESSEVIELFKFYNIDVFKAIIYAVAVIGINLTLSYIVFRKAELK